MRAFVRLLMVASLAVASALSAQTFVPEKFVPPSGLYGVREVIVAMVPMRDGAHLRTYIWLPLRTPKAPIVLTRTVYDPHEFWETQGAEGPNREAPEIQFWTGRGYAFVVQSERGRYGSEGSDSYVQKWGEDAYDTMTWLARQTWTNGRIGTWGCSNEGNNQPAIATMNHPNHKAAIIRFGGDGMGNGVADLHGFFERGNVGHGVPERLWELAFGSNVIKPQYAPYGNPFGYGRLPLISNLSEYDVATYPQGGVRYFDDGDRWSVPTLWVDSWYDYAPGETLQMFNAASGSNAMNARVADNQRVIMFPTIHCQDEDHPARTHVGERDLGPLRIPIWDKYLAWFDYWLKGQGPSPAMPKVQYFVMGKETWRTADTWPARDTTAMTLYLSGSGAANSRFGNGMLSADAPRSDYTDSFVYDPRTPVPTVGGTGVYKELGLGADVPKPGAFDQSGVEMRQDVLVYTTAPLANGVEVTGTPEVVLYVSSSARDTDFTVKLVDVDPAGPAYNIKDRTFRVRYRDGGGSAYYTPKGWVPKWMEKGKVYRLDFKMAPTSNWFAPGHRIRIEVSSSNFPDSVRNLNTGGDNLTEAEMVVAENYVHRGPAAPSAIILPTRPEPDAAAAAAEDRAVVGLLSNIDGPERSVRQSPNKRTR